jgi:DNA polymerase III subunit epsilon
VTVADVVGVPIAPEVLARALDRHPKFRVLRLIEPMVRRMSRTDRTPTLEVAVVDVETTGLDWRTDKVIELGVQRVSIDDQGRIIDVGQPRGWFEYPGGPIPEEIVRKTKITDDMVHNQAIPDGVASGMIEGADMVLAHNAGFDRPFVEKRLSIGPKPWICSLRDIDWEEFGFGSQKLEDLLIRCGWFFDGAHRAVNDVNALLHLLDHRLDGGRTVMKELWANALEPSWLVEAKKTPYGSNKALKSHRYAWDSYREVWWKHVRDGRQLEEQQWLIDDVYKGNGYPEMRRMNWKERYAGIE